MAALILHVCILYTKRDHFDYEFVGTTVPALGVRVLVPFGKQMRLGVIVGYGSSDGSLYACKLIDTVLDLEPVLPANILTLCQWVSEYYQTPLSEVLPLAITKIHRVGKEVQIMQPKLYSLAMAQDSAQQLLSNRAVRQRALLDFFVKQAKPLSKQTLQAAGFQQAQVDALLAHNILSIVSVDPYSALPTKILEMPLTLHDEQSQAIAAIIPNLQAYHGFLLDGVTGSGKTEVYLQIIAIVLSRQQQAL